MRIKADAILVAATEDAREAARGIAEPGTVGEHQGVVMDAERLATHYFACTAKGYPGWRWAVAMARVPRGKKATICETNLVPGEGALLSPAWVPYDQRLAPGDLGAGDVLPYIEDDQRLEPGMEATGDEETDEAAQWELGLGRRRVLSAEGREEAAERWYRGEGGPTSSVAEKAPAPCSTCGFFLPMAGALRSFFGVCANAWSPSDGHVVSLDHGCGAHSEIDVVREDPKPAEEHVLDEFAFDLV
ncbi:MAG: hypothetical protein QOF35_1662 [Actinomycetota bacterium]|nr:hypothetical protein [Actinomycetota bacterium]